MNFSTLNTKYIFQILDIKLTQLETSGRNTFYFRRMLAQLLHTYKASMINLHLLLLLLLILLLPSPGTYSRSPTGRRGHTSQD